MRRLLVLTLLLVSCAQLSARDVINFNRNWRFFSNTDGNSDGAIIVNLPHTWNDDALSGKKDYFRGVGNYIKNLDVPADWAGKRIYIRFGGAATVANLIVNGRHVGEHRGGYTAFAFELTQFLKYGESNVLWMMVNNAPQLDVLPTAGDMNIYGGLYRDVELIVTEPTHIAVTDDASAGVMLKQRDVSADRAEVDAVVSIDGQRDRNLLVSLVVSTPTFDTISLQVSKFRVPASGKGNVTIPFTLDNPTLWNGVQNPYLYSVGIKVMEDGVTRDSISMPMGLRYFSVDPQKGFFLNGQPYPLRGAIYYEDRATQGTALAPYQIEEDMDYIQEMGANAVRAAAFPHNEHFYRECDRRGIIVWSDLPFMGPAYLTDRGYMNMQPLRDNGKLQLREMIRQNYNHPSVVAWGVFSNQDLRGDDPIPYIKELNDLVVSEDPSRMTAASSNQDGMMNFITDLIVWDHTLGWKEGQPSDILLVMEQLESKWGHLRSGISYGAGGSIYHQDDSLYRPVYYSNWHPERWQTYFHQEYYSYVSRAPYFWGTFVANMFDYGAAGRTWGERTGIDDRGLVTFDRKYRKDAFYFYKANWNPDDPFVYIAEKRWNNRPTNIQDFKIFSNHKEVELVVNGITEGQKIGRDGTFVWEKVVLREGLNVIEARAGADVDRAYIQVNSYRSKYGVTLY